MISPWIARLQLYLIPSGIFRFFTSIIKSNLKDTTEPIIQSRYARLALAGPLEGQNRAMTNNAAEMCGIKPAARSSEDSKVIFTPVQTSRSSTSRSHASTRTRKFPRCLLTINFVHYHNRDTPANDPNDQLTIELNVHDSDDIRW